MIGTAMLILAAIYFAAALFRKKVLNWVTSTAVNVVTRNVSSDILQKYFKTMVGLESINTFSNWFKNKKSDENIDKSPHKIENLNEKVDVGKFPEVLGPDPDEENENVIAGQPPKNPPRGFLTGETIFDVKPQSSGENVWEGQPPEGYPFKEIGYNPFAGKKAGNTSIDINAVSTTPKGVETGGSVADSAAMVGESGVAVAAGAEAVTGPVGIGIAVATAGADAAKKFANEEANAVVANQDQDEKLDDVDTASTPGISPGVSPGGSGKPVNPAGAGPGVSPGGGGKPVNSAGTGPGVSPGGGGKPVNPAGAGPGVSPGGSGKPVNSAGTGPGVSPGGGGKPVNTGQPTAEITYHKNGPEMGL